MGTGEGFCVIEDVVSLYWGKIFHIVGQAGEN